MTSNSRSSTSESFELLETEVQKWVSKQEWDEFHYIQEKAIPLVLEKETDLIISAPTAAGKTEAVFLPIFSSMINIDVNSIFTLYLSPLKALINDQFKRLREIAEASNQKITPWHGDVSTSKKRKLRENPGGVLLITPESLEALFVNYGSLIPEFFAELQYVVIDEIHSFMGTERGRQIQSLLNRIEVATNNEVPRFGLSATIGNLKDAGKYLRPNQDKNCELIKAKGDGSGVKLQIRGYEEEKPDEEDEEQIDPISEHIFEKLRGKSNLIFANSRSNVEYYADQLRKLCEELGVPNEFWPHHGNLSKELREEIEHNLKQSNTPSTAVCTSTLEMGIDIGDVESIAQIGVPPSVASVRQRLGRSGRRGNPAILRIYIEENDITSQTSIPFRLRSQLVQSIAMINLLIDRWYEPPTFEKLHGSTFVQQILSCVAQFGGIQALDLWVILCEKGPFKDISKDEFQELLKTLGRENFITQASDSTLVLDVKGENVVGHYSFYAVFQTPEEYQLISSGKTLGTLPINFPVLEDSFLIFAGERWKVLKVDDDKKTIELTPAPGGNVPVFGGAGIDIHDRIRAKMFEIYNQNNAPEYLNQKGTELLSEGREWFRKYELDENLVIADGQDSLIFIWKGSVIKHTISLLLTVLDHDVMREGLALRVKETQPEEVKESFKQVAKMDVSDVELADKVKNKKTEKYDYLLTSALLNKDYASHSLDVPKTKKYISQKLIGDSEKLN